MSGVARYFGAVQADSDRGCLGAHPPVSDYGGVHHCVRQMAKLPSDGTAPYALMVFAGMLPWSFFAAGLTDASNSVISNANLISKVYFPRLIVPIAAVMVAFVDFLISFAILVALMAWYRFMPGWQILLLPAFMAITFIASLGVGAWITAINVKYRDFRYVIPFIVQLGLYVSPVGFSSSIIPEQWRLVYSLNPMVGVIDGFRWCLLGGESQIYLPGLSVSLFVAGFFLWFGNPPVQEDGKRLR